jgi:hypothetical protein
MVLIEKIGYSRCQNPRAYLARCRFENRLTPKGEPELFF